jgi:DNA replication protein DnaC
MEEHTPEQANHCFIEYSAPDVRKALIEMAQQRKVLPAAAMQNEFKTAGPKEMAANQFAWDQAKLFNESSNLVAYLWGAPGTGKSYTASCILNQAFDLASIREKKTKPGCVGAYVTGIEFVRRMRKFEPGPILDEWKKAHVLVMDDFDKPSWEYRDIAGLYDLMDARMIHKNKTVFTTNCDPKRLQHLFKLSSPAHGNIWEALRQRLVPAMVLEYSGQTLRTTISIAAEKYPLNQPTDAPTR